jgi:hypothetical protein
MTKLKYEDNEANTYLVIHANASIEVSAGAVHVYGWRNPGDFSASKSSLQYARYEGFDFIDLAAIKLGNAGDQTVFALSVAGRWRWLQIAVFWPINQFTLYKSNEPLTNIITIDDAPAPLVVEDVAIADDFTDGVIPVWYGGKGYINAADMKIKTPMPFKSGDGTGEYPSGGTGPINPSDYQFTDNTYAKYPTPETTDG